MIRSSKPSSLVCPLATICGSKLPLRSRGIASSIAPSSPSTVLLEWPLRLFPLPRPAGSPFSYPRCSLSSALQQFLLELFEEPLFTEQILRGAISLQQLLDHLVSDRLCHVRDPLYHIECLMARTYTRYRTPSQLVQAAVERILLDQPKIG